MTGIVRLSHLADRDLDEVFREVLAALHSREQELVAIQEGIDDMEAGHMRSIRGI